VVAELLKVTVELRASFVLVTPISHAAAPPLDVVSRSSLTVERPLAAAAACVARGAVVVDRRRLKSLSVRPIAAQMK